MPGSCTEALQFRSRGALVPGIFTFPARTPPLPLAVVVPGRAGLDADGASADLPGARPWLELAIALGRQGLGNFRFASPAAAPLSPAGLADAWRHAARHHLVSRARPAVVVEGAALNALTEAWSSLCATGPPMALIAIGGPSLDPAAFPGVDTSQIHLGAAPNPPDPATPGTHIPDATEHWLHVAHWLAGRPAVHRGLLDAIVRRLRADLVPVWERANRPPGTAIG